MTIAVTADSGGVRPWLTYYVIETYPLVAIPYRALSTSRFRLQYANTLCLIQMHVAYRWFHFL